MTRAELVQELMKYPSDSKVILAEELGASELEAGQITFETMNYNEFEHHNKKFGVYYSWEYPSDYKRKTIKSEMVIIIT